jgi:outer membrane protein assembly factor BamB
MGHASPVIWGDKVFVLSADPNNATRYVICLHAADGKTLWTRQFPSTPHRFDNQFSSYASASPAVDAERVYAAWASPEETTLLALDHQGRDVWRLDLGPWVGTHCFGISPIVYKDLVILSNSQQAEQLREGQKPGVSFIAAFDRQSGRQRWRTPRTSRTVCYSTPCIHQPPGGPAELICCNTGDGVFSLDPETGKENWSIVVFDKRVVSSPLLACGLVFGSTGSGGGGGYVTAVRPGKKPEAAYTVKKQAPYVPTPVARGDLVFLWSDKGVVTCLDGPTGDVVWQERVGGSCFGSPVLVRDKLYCIDADGVVHVLAAEKQFRELGRNPLGEPSRATPAVSGGKMYLRTFSRLVAIGER